MEQKVENLKRESMVENLQNFNIAKKGLMILPFLIVVLGLYFYSKPYTYVVRGEAAIVCNNSHVYPASPNQIDKAEALYEFTQNGFEDGAVRENDLRARKLCAYGVARDFIPFRSAPREVNYTVRLGTSAPSITYPDSNVTLR